MLDVAKLATLRAVVAHGSFSAAGHAVGLTQPAVSRQVSLLERRVGTQLVRRTPQGVYPTEAGRVLVEHTDVLLDRATALRSLSAAELDVAIVFEHAFESAPPPPDVELVTLFDDPPCALLPASHPLARADQVRPDELAADTWIRAHNGSAARFVDHVLAEAALTP